MQKKQHTIEEIIEQQILQNISYKALDLARVKNMVLISYENEISSVENLIRKLLKVFGSNIENEKVIQIVEKYSRQNVNKVGENVIYAGVKNKFKLNAINGFHENHFFDGKSDKYINLLDASTIKTLANQTKDFNAFFSYDILTKNFHDSIIYGLIRSEALSKTSLWRNINGSANSLIFELCLLGEFVEIKKVLSFYNGTDCV